MQQFADFVMVFWHLLKPAMTDDIESPAVSRISYDPYASALLSRRYS